MNHRAILDKILQHIKDSESQRISADCASAVSQPCAYQVSSLDWLPSEAAKLSELLGGVAPLYRYTNSELNSIIKFLIEVGADLPSYIFTEARDAVFSNIDLFLHREKNPLSATALLAHVTANALYSDISSKTDVIGQKAVLAITYLIEAGADLSSHMGSEVTRFIFSNIELLLNRAKNPLSTTVLLTYVTDNALMYNRSSGTWILVPGTEPVITSLLEAGADLPRYVGPEVRVAIFSNIELLLNREKNAVPPTQLLEWTAVHAHVYNHSSPVPTVDPKAAETIKYLVNAGADFPMYTSREVGDVIAVQAELFLTRAQNPMSPTDLLRMGARMAIDGRIFSKVHDLIKCALENGADIHAKLYEEDDDGELSLSIFERLFMAGKLDLLDGAPYIEIRSIVWLAAMHANPGLSFIISALKKFHCSLSVDEIFDLCRARGASVSTAQQLIDTDNLAKDYIAAVDNLDAGILNAVEISLLSGARLPLQASEYANLELSNKYGFKPLHLAILGANFPLAKEMIIHGHSLTQPNHNGTTPLTLLGQYLDKNDRNTLLEDLMQVALSKIEDVDIDLGTGETLCDNLLRVANFTNVTLSLTQDPLFKFLKPRADLSVDTSKVNIAISHAEGFWSTGPWSTARLMRAAYPQINFHLVDLESMQLGGDKFIQQFDGWFNPGGGDNYPKGVEFSLSDLQTFIKLITTYQHALNRTTYFSIPSMGMCAGAQNLALYSGGYIGSLKGYDSGARSVVFLEGTVSHYMSMTRDQQRHTLAHCEFPSIVVVGDTAHSFAASTYKLGELKLGAISTAHGVAMAYSNGLAFATQFHPEHKWHLVNGSLVNHQREWLNNFLHLAQLHHEARDGQAPHPKAIMDAIEVRLHECMDAPTSLAPDQPLLGDQALADTFFA